MDTAHNCTPALIMMVNTFNQSAAKELEWRTKLKQRHGGLCNRLVSTLAAFATGYEVIVDHLNLQDTLTQEDHLAWVDAVAQLNIAHCVQPGRHTPSHDVVNVRILVHI